MDISKVFTHLCVILILFSCSKKTTELEVTHDKEISQARDTTDTVTEDKKPLIYIGKDDTLQIYARADGAPGMYVDENGSIVGFYVDLERMVMEEMGQKYQMNSYTDLGPLIQDIKSGKAHSALAAFDVPDFRALAHLSDAYENLEYVIFLRNNNNDTIPDNTEGAIGYLYGKKVGVQTRGHIYQMLRNHKDIEIVEYPTTTEALAALNNGEVDAVPDVERIGIYYSNQNSWNIKPASIPVLSFKTVTGFSKALDYEVVERYNKALNTLIDNGSVAQLYSDYFGE